MYQAKRLYADNAPLSGYPSFEPPKNGLSNKVAKPVTQFLSGDKEMSRYVMERFMSRAGQQAYFKFVT